ncbi:hypothetical protein [Maritimibacter sp. DP1N21-5]|uniref:hypothetical protein n=1 Tax=Maritimibacter sp. DP1N21-5 TaxID=2836867 RepID=UPI001C44C44D|nr:hypothetical protein [Maritimibacter sp. DP1N21-5]MBV7408614.1 hypothetical protein [Maritimibacter sp. DP1N21-5]
MRMTFDDFLMRVQNRVAARRARTEEALNETSDRMHAIREYMRGLNPLVIATLPVIYSVFFAFVVLDLFVTLYMWICFPIYRIPMVRRREYVVVDRGRLPYLNPFQKLNCLYCGYGNGVLAYATEVAARTEAYWCPIKHEHRAEGRHQYYDDFMDYGDETDFDGRWSRSRYRITEGRDDTRPVNAKRRG